MAIVLHRRTLSGIPVTTLVHATRLDGAARATARVRTITAGEQMLTGAVMLLAIVAPLERPMVAVPPGFTITTLEAAVLLVVVIWAVNAIRARRMAAWRSDLTWPGVAFLAVLLISALLSPIDRGNALRFAGRMVAAAIVFVATMTAISSRDAARTMVQLLLATATVIAAAAVLEAAQVPAVMNALTLFRPGFHVVGGQLRATSTLFYPTIASMYLEVVFALGLWLLLESAAPAVSAGLPSTPMTTASLRAGKSRHYVPAGRLYTSRAIVFAALTIVGAGIIATFTRAGLIGIAAALILVGVLRAWHTRRVDAGHALLGALGAVLLVVVLASRSPELLLTRLQTEGSQAWYGATYAAPPTLRLAPGSEQEVPVVLRNTGRLTWDSTLDPPFAMSYHWLRADGEAVVQFDGWRTPFERPVAPGTSVTLPVAVKAPGQPGKYVLAWDVVHEGRAWLSTEGVPSARSIVEVAGRPSGDVVTTMRRLPEARARVERPALWAAALRIAAAYPLLGVGPDNFRQVYGRYAGLERWDTRVHANNMYLEVLAGAGSVGLAALLWLVAATGVSLVRRVRHASASDATALAGASAAWLMIAGHGLVDSFLSFTTTYVIFALAAGLACSVGLRGDGSR